MAEQQRDTHVMEDKNRENMQNRDQKPEIGKQQQQGSEVGGSNNLNEQSRLKNSDQNLGGNRKVS